MLYMSSIVEMEKEWGIKKLTRSLYTVYVGMVVIESTAHA